MTIAAFRVDGSPRMGSGHVMRCLALADALALEGWRSIFVAAALDNALAERIEDAGHSLARINPGGRLEDPGPDWDRASLPAAAQTADADAFLAALEEQPAWVILDHYQLDAGWEGIARSQAARIMVIDDLANRPHDCDILLDQSAGRSTADYRTLVPAGARLLTGPMFALLRPEFAKQRRRALDRRRQFGPVKRILVSLGASDVGNLTVDAAKSALSAFPDAIVDVVLGPQAAAFPEIEALAASSARIRAHPNPPSMARLMIDADLAIGAGGTTSWERCCLGLPSALLALAENQRFVIEQLGGMGAAIGVADSAALDSALRELSGPDVRAAMAAAAFALCDGEGVGRVLKELGGRDQERAFSLRTATEADSETLWLWRNDPGTRRESTDSNPIPWSAHSEWFGRTISQGESTLLMAEASAGPIGMIRLDPCEGSALLVSINIAPTLRGEGVGKRLLAAAVDQFGAAHLRAEVRKENDASRRIFEDCGFVASEQSGTFLSFERLPQS